MFEKRDIHEACVSYRNASSANTHTHTLSLSLSLSSTRNNLEPAKVVEAVKEAARSQAGFEGQSHLSSFLHSSTLSWLVGSI